MKRREMISDPQNTIFLSSVSSAEIAIKYSIGKLDLPKAPSEYVPLLRQNHQITELPFYESASLLLADLPLIHRDPFDRQLICQAMAHQLTFLSSDPMIHEYTGFSVM